MLLLLLLLLLGVQVTSRGLVGPDGKPLSAADPEILFLPA